MTLKLWDLNKESSPVATYNVHEHLRARVSRINLVPGLTRVVVRGYRHLSAFV